MSKRTPAPSTSNTTADFKDFLREWARQYRSDFACLHRAYYDTPTKRASFPEFLAYTLAFFCYGLSVLPLAFAIVAFPHIPSVDEFCGGLLLFLLAFILGCVFWTGGDHQRDKSS